MSIDEDAEAVQSYILLRQNIQEIGSGGRWLEMSLTRSHLGIVEVAQPSWVASIGKERGFKVSMQLHCQSVLHRGVGLYLEKPLMLRFEACGM